MKKVILFEFLFHFITVNDNSEIETISNKSVRRVSLMFIHWYVIALPFSEVNVAFGADHLIFLSRIIETSCNISLRVNWMGLWSYSKC